jgi:D-alanine--poly(phosphoribitol) ligase subunit 1
MRINPADGKLHFVGRKDNQIKHMGYRIELEEIEAAFNGVEGVVQSAVIYKRVKAQYGHIIAFVSGGHVQLVPEHLESELRKRLPEYMIPNRIEIWDVLPKNANGKVDKKKLSEES